MTKRKLNYSTWAPIAFVVLTIAVAMGLSRATTATGSAITPPVVDLANEERVINRYGDDLAGYERDVLQLNRKAALVSADLDPLQRRSDDLKNRLAEVQNAAQAVLRKLNTANEWAEVDETVSKNTTDPRVRSLFQERSFKTDLEEALNLSAQQGEISTPLDSLRKKLTRHSNSGSDLQMLNAAYASPAFARVGLGCRIGRVGLRITIAVGKTPSKEQTERVFNRCHPDGTINPF